MKHSIIPPTINVEDPAPGCDLNYVPNHFLRKEVQTALINAHGFGGRVTTNDCEEIFVRKDLISKMDAFKRYKYLVVS